MNSTGGLEEAENLLKRALTYPLSLGEGRLEGTKDNNVYYYLGIISREKGDENQAKEYFRLATLGENEPAGVRYYYDQPADMILYKGLAHQAMSESREANTCFNKLNDYGERHLNDPAENDFFAVSLPDFLIFDEDMEKKNRAHCYYLMGLAAMGRNQKERAEEHFLKALKLENSHQNAIDFLRDLNTANQ